MGKEAQKSALPALFHFVRVRAAFQPHVFKTIIEFQWVFNPIFDTSDPYGLCPVQNLVYSSVFLRKSNLPNLNGNP